jgi:hypothetical protein
MKKKKNKFLFESPPEIDLNSSKNYDSENLQSKESDDNYSSIDKINRFNQRDRDPYKENEGFVQVNNSKKEDKKSKYTSDLYDLFENLYDIQLKSEEAALELKKNPGMIEETLIYFNQLFDAVLAFDQEQYKKYVKSKNDSFHTILIGNNPIFRQTSNGGYVFDSKLIDNFVNHQLSGENIAKATRMIVYGMPETILNSYLFPLGNAIVNGYNLSVKVTDDSIEYIKNNLSFFDKVCTSLYKASNKIYDFFTDEQNHEMISDIFIVQNAMQTGNFKNNPYINQSLQNISKIKDDKSVQEKFNITKNELNLNRSFTRSYFLNTVLNDIDEDEEDVKSNKDNISDISQKIENSMKNLIQSTGQDMKLDPADFKNSFDRLKGYVNYTPEQLINNPELIDNISNQIEDSIRDVKENKEIFSQEEINSIQKLAASFIKTKDLFKDVKNNFQKIKEDTKVFENIKRFYKDQGIFNLSTNLDTLKNNYKNYLQEKHKQQEDILNDPLNISEESLKISNFKKDLFLLRFHIKLIDMVVYFLNRFTEKILKEDKNSFRGDNFLTSIYQICLNDVNRKTFDEQKYSAAEELDLQNIVKSFKDINIVTKSFEKNNDNTDSLFFSKDNKLLSNDDKIVGFYSRKKNSDKIDMILESLRKHYNPTYDRDEKEKTLDNKRLQTGSFGIEEPEPITSQDLDPDFELQLKLIFTKIEIALKNLTLLDTIVLLSNRNVTNKKDSKLLQNDYLLYQIDISNLYPKIFNNPKLWDYIITLNKQEEQSGEFKIQKPLNMTEELKDFKIFNLIDYINTNVEEKITINYNNIETKEKETLDFTIESFQFLNKQISNKKENDLNPIELKDLFEAADLGFLTQNKNIFIDA